MENAINTDDTQQPSPTWDPFSSLVATEGMPQSMIRVVIRPQHNIRSITFDYLAYPFQNLFFLSQGTNIRFSRHVSLLSQEFCFWLGCFWHVPWCDVDASFFTYYKAALSIGCSVHTHTQERIHLLNSGLRKKKSKTQVTRSPDVFWQSR